MSAAIKFRSPFIDGDYSADRNIHKHYYDQGALLISKAKGLPYEDVRKVLAEKIRPNNGTFTDAKMQVLMKNKVGDRELKVITSSEFFNEVQRNNYHLSPSFVAYTTSDEEDSINEIGPKRFIAQRNIFMKACDKSLAAVYFLLFHRKI